MGAEIQWREPDVFASGDSLIFQRYLPDYLPANGWALRYTLTSLAANIGVKVEDINSQAQGDSHLINVNAFAAGLDAGDYLLVGFAVNGAERHQIYYGELTLVPDLADGTAVTKPLTTHAQRMITVLETQMEKLAAHSLRESDVQRSRFVWERRGEVLDLLNFYRERRNYELKLLAVANGHGNQNQIVPRFNCG